MQVTDRNVSRIITEDRNASKGLPLYKSLRGVVMVSSSFPLWHKVNKPNLMQVPGVNTTADMSRGHQPCCTQRTEFQHSKEMDQWLAQTDTQKAVS